MAQRGQQSLARLVPQGAQAGRRAREEAAPRTFSAATWTGHKKVRPSFARRPRRFARAPASLLPDVRPAPKHPCRTDGELPKSLANTAVLLRGIELGGLLADPPSQAASQSVGRFIALPIYQRAVSFGNRDRAGSVGLHLTEK